jgi:iron complex transport system ATP-binding protein
MSAVTLRDASVSRGGIDIIRSLSLDIPSGSWCVIVGPNGAGKSTLISALAGTLGHRGDIEIGGRDVAKLSIRERAQLVAVVPQQPLLPGGMTVTEYVMLGRTAHLSPYGREGKRDIRLVDETLQRLDLCWLAGRDVEQLSGGEKQRALIARALVQEPKVLLLDEPTNALDIHHQQQALELVDTLRNHHDLTVISALHDLTLAAQYGDAIALLTCGSLMAHGTALEVLTEERVRSVYGADVLVRMDPEAGLVVLPCRTRSEVRSRGEHADPVTRSQSV